MNARTFRARTLQDNDLPWLQQREEGFLPTVWGVNLNPKPVWEDESNPVGEPIYYEWQALLDPADTPLPDWIEEVTPPVETPANPSLVEKLKGIIGL